MALGRLLAGSAGFEPGRLTAYLLPPMDPTVTAVRRCFALQARWQQYPNHIATTYRRWFAEAFGEAGDHLWRQLDPADVAGWFANLDAGNRAIFLAHPHFS